MFISTSGFKHMLRMAYKSGSLELANDGGYLIIKGRNYQMGIYPEYLSNKEKVALIEIAGELPKEGEQFRCEPLGNQMLILEGLGAMPEPKGGVEYMNTPVLIANHIRLLQDPYTLSIIGADASIIDNISNAFLSDAEAAVSAPVSDGDFIRYENNAMFLNVWCYRLDDYPFIKALEGVRVEKET